MSAPTQLSRKWQDLKKRIDSGEVRLGDIENFMIKMWGKIPREWNDPQFRTEIIGQPITDIEAFMNNSTLAYEGQERHGQFAQGIMFNRNVDRQGVPRELQEKFVEGFRPSKER